MNKRLFGFAFIFLGLVVGVASQWPDGGLHVTLCDVGQGDAILLTQGFTQVLIDGGPNRRVVDCLSSHMPFWDRTLEVMVASHPDKDHITGLADVIDNYNLISFVSINRADKSAEFANLKNKIVEKKISPHIAKSGERIIAGKIKLGVLWPEENEDKDLVWLMKQSSGVDNQTLGASDKQGDDNDFSVVMRASFGNFDVLLTGDIDAEIESRLVERFDLSGTEVLKVAHHGSRYATSKKFLEQVKPKVVLIGVGKNSWGHPTEEVLGRLGEIGAKILRTDTMGEVDVVSDGEEWWIR